MRRARGILTAGLLATVGISAPVLPCSDDPAPGNPAQARARELYRQRVEPMLRVKCLGCHGDGEELDGDLDLRTRDAMLRGGKSGPALVPGKPRASLIYQAVRRTDERVMPPRDRERLADDEITALGAWIEAGAP
jgi:mono/diheme cytochrome c family protein